MLELMISKKDGYYYYFRDMNENEYKLNIEFYDLLNNPKIGDYLYINSGLLEESGSLLCFGPIDEDYGRNVDSLDCTDLVVLCTGDDKKYLKRYYG